jgi:hypothetical protein
MIMSLVVAGAFGLSYVRAGDRFDLVIGLLSGGLAAIWLVRARSVGDAPAPPLRNPRAVKRLSAVCGAAGGILLLTMLWRIQGEWPRLIEQGNLWLAMGWIILLGIAVAAPIEWRSAGARRSSAIAGGSVDRG